MGRLLGVVVVVELGMLMDMMRLLRRLDVVDVMGLDVGLKVEVVLVLLLGLTGMVAHTLELLLLLLLLMRLLQVMVQVLGVWMELIARVVYCYVAVIVFCRVLLGVGVAQTMTV